MDACGAAAVDVLATGCADDFAWVAATALGADVFDATWAEAGATGADELDATGAGDPVALPLLAVVDSCGATAADALAAGCVDDLDGLCTGDLVAVAVPLSGAWATV